MTVPTHWLIKFRPEGEKTFSFLGSRGSQTRLRVHAARFPSRAAAQDFTELNGPLNPGIEWRVISA